MAAVQEEETVNEVPTISAQTIIVIHPGSLNLRIGLASHHQPITIPHVIARRCKNKKLKRSRKNHFRRDGYKDTESNHLMEAALANINHALRSHRSNYGIKSQHYTILTHNKNVKCEMVAQDPEKLLTWNDVNDQPDFVVGPAALYIEESEPYELFWPIKFGQINRHKGISGSVTAIFSDLADIWKAAIEGYLDIPATDFENYKALVLIPDIYDRSLFKHYADLLLNTLGFSGMFLYQESVAASFGAGFPSACVVDIGDQKASICCIDDGISIPETRLRISYGGKDITRCFYYLLDKIYFPYRDLSPYNHLDLILIKHLKEDLCHLDPTIPGGAIHDFIVAKPDCDELHYSIRLGDELLQAPLALFYPSLMGIIDEDIITTQPSVPFDSEDIMDDPSLLESTQSQSGKVGPKSSSANQSNSATPTPETPQTANSLSNNLSDKNIVSIDQAIVYSIDSCPTDELKKKALSSILLVGKGFMFDNAAFFLQARIRSKLPTGLKKYAEQIDVTGKVRDMDPGVVAWKGAAVLSCLDSAQELWISPEEWNKYRIQILRERSPFVW
ncbi:uncharacterized protein TRIADDRAFT_53825 [Trichoplax adhaerens]|uniref:Uncharacterized protein n=1 Tax=Trichoplax adhaerens TaxID=10228 RepID=B3RQ97_TRIAD|nr:hypothetical protein TRIADDRAFT_53825 [Trichoplax adhaerens]EDV27788.1 hypothetical protein TRIADDRAFT_53825 [Trichoplax adhaerens]|eukprot:XP_002109622.1 hypothetical protein TRIADDRAFT_53825 [Trichoplax adhaerens]